jgi:uncharacterized SAM-binding protein YcdF (DUF218 family)
MQLRSSSDPFLHRDIAHSLAAATLAVLLSGGLLYAVYLLRVWRVAVQSPPGAADEACVLVFGKRLVDGEPDADYRERLHRAHRLATTAPQRPLVLLGGGSDGITEAATGLRVLQQLGLPEGTPVHLEDQSLDTLQNLRNAREMLGGDHDRPLLLLSNRYHLARCHSLAQALGLHSRPCAAEAEFRWREQRVARLAQEAAYLCWFEVGAAWARLIGHRRMLARVS